MFLELKDAAVIQPQSFPHRVAALHNRIKRTHARLITMHQAAIDVDYKIAVFLVKLLKHRLFPATASGVHTIARNAPRTGPATSPAAAAARSASADTAENS